MGVMLVMVSSDSGVSGGSSSSRTVVVTVGKIIAVKPEDTLLTTMMLLACAITQHFLTPTNNRLRTSSNIRNHAYVQDGRVEIQGKNSRYVGVNRRNIRNQERNYVNQGIVAGNNIVQTTDGDIEIMQRNLQTTANNSAMDDDQLEELNTLVIMMARLQPEDNESNVEPKYDLILSASWYDEDVGLEAVNSWSFP
nr:hypothetical protein [Tanacetum cinerariifolium]